MAIRNFTDAEGVHWTVWSTMPYTTGVAGSLQRGWLTFEAGQVRRRLAPIPDGWEDLSVEKLSDLCEKADPTLRTPHSGVFPVVRRDE